MKPSCCLPTDQCIRLGSYGQLDRRATQLDVITYVHTRIDAAHEIADLASSNSRAQLLLIDAHLLGHRHREGAFSKGGEP